MNFKKKHFNKNKKILAPRRVCNRKVDLINTTQMIIDDGGEGTMLRKPESPYQHGRSTLLLKFKVNFIIIL